MRDLKILISNDDGYFAPGIQALAAALRPLGTVAVVAPDRNRSGASSGLTLTQPINVTPHGELIYGVEGTPADCVNVALGGLLSWTPDLVVAGINDGPNMADDCLYSGTVAAAIEGRFLGMPSIALSMGASHPKHFETAAAIARELVEGLVQTPLSPDTILNVNVPDLAAADIKGRKVTRLGSRFKPDQAGVHANPRGDAQYWLGPAGEQNDRSEGTDFYAIENDFVSITPLTIDMTRHSAVESTQQWLTSVAPS